MIVQPYAFTGREYDLETGLYYYRARYYDPRAGRFITRDPIGFAGGINQYNYVRNNPVRYVDPLGLTRIRIFIETGAMWIDPEQPSRIPYIIPITSGKAESMNRPECSGKENEGPIPKGSYTVDVTQLSNPSKIRDLFNMRYGDWGDWNVPLIPDSETDTYGRRNFYLHGGLFPGSSGCVDFGGGIFGNSITDQLLKDMLSDTSRKIKVTVR